LFFLVQGWEFLSIHSIRRENLVGFDHEAAVKRNLSISAQSLQLLPDGTSVLLLVHEGINNYTANHSLLLEFQSWKFGDMEGHRKW
jgi:hypothetical protein